MLGRIAVSLRSGAALECDLETIGLEELLTMFLSTSGRSKCPEAWVVLTATLGSAWASLDSEGALLVDLSSPSVLRPAVLRSLTLFNMRRPAPLRRPPMLVTVVSKDDEASPGDAGGDSLVICGVSVSAGLMVRTEVVVDMMDRDLSPWLG